MSNLKLLLSFFLFFISFASSSSSSSSNNTHRCSPIQTHALLLFKHNLFSTNHSYDVMNEIIDYECHAWLGPKYYPIMMNWNTRIDCCNWDGVTCNHFTGDVIGLDLSCGMLQGTIHPNTTLFNLPHLQTLNLAFNDFFPSQLPREIGRFSNSLTHLNISECGFTGQIPSDIFNLRYLEKLNLSNNWFTGQIPSDVSLLTKLVSLDLSGSWFGLQIQPQVLQIQPQVLNNLLRNCTLLRDLSLAAVNLSYVLPTYLNISSSLKSLDLSDTYLQGKLPDNIFNLQYLEKLGLSGNNDLTGPLPKVNRSVPLKWLSLSGPRLISREIPNSITHLKYLNVLQLSSCGLMGPLPKSLVNLTHLTTLDLSYNMLNGTLPSWLFTLPSLENIDLSENMFYGSLPSELFGLQSLKQLSLGNNQFVGKITQQTFQQLVNLTHLDLSFNNFKGDWELDTLLSSLTTLVYLDLSYSGLSLITHNANHYINPDFLWLSLASCKLTVFPESLRSMKNLGWLDLSNNEIHGHIPDWAGEIGANELVYLNLSHNFITGLPQQFQWDGLGSLYIQSNLIQGPFPPSICNLKDLVSLDMSNNSFSGVIPQCFGNTSFSLESIDLHSNLIQGSFPPSICNLSSLWILDMSNNSFSGVIPQCFGNTSFFSLERIDLHSNLIQGPFPPAICDLSNLRYLDMSDNSFSGVIPQCFGNTSFFSLARIDLHSNLIEGPFPPAICNLKDLMYLDMSNNNFSGVIPQCFGNISLMIDMSNNRFHGTIPNVFEHCDLDGLILNGNHLEGEVPSSLSNCHYLRVLDLGNNHLNGAFPDWSQHLPQLQVLVLKSNKLHGPIENSSMIPHPFPSLKVLDLSQNEFIGHLPGKYFLNLDAMKNVVKEGREPVYLSLDGSKYYSVTIAVKDLQLSFPKLLVDYTVVDLSSNRFEGEIPSIVGSLNSLKVLNLSHNHLNGRIPYALGNISEIESLDLSWNQLTGEIPQSLADITGLEVLNLSQNRLVGRIPGGTQFSTFSTSFGGNPGLCGFPLPKLCENLSRPQLEADEDEESGFTWKAVLLGYGCGTLVGLAMGYLMLSTGKPKWFNAIADAGEQMMERRRNKRR